MARGAVFLNDKREWFKPLSLYAKFWSLLLFQKPACQKNKINLQQLWNNP